MRSKWEEYPYSDYIEIIGGGTPRTKNQEYWDGNIPWISVKDFLNDSKYIYSTEKHITEKGLSESSTKYLQKDDIIISARGTVGKLAMIPFPMTFNQSCYGIRGINKQISQHFLYYSLQNSVRNILRNTHGSVFDTITRVTFENIFFPLPPLSTQKAIADTLSCLDAKIELNNKINANLEAQAQAIFKSWFVDFDPFLDGEFVESELGLIPKGWSVGKLDEIIELHDSQRIPLSGRVREKMEKVYPYYGAASLMDYVDDYIFNGTYLLLGEDGTVIDDFGYPILQYAYGKFWVNNHAHVITGKKVYTVEHLYMLFRNTNVNSAITGAVQKKINQGNLKSIQIVIPPKSEVEKYNDLISPFFQYRKQNEKQSTTLATLRDTLLPKLMSGEVEVPINE